MIASDFSRRGVPWARLLLDRKMLGAPRGLSLGASERLSALAAALFVAASTIAIMKASLPVAIVALSCLIVFLIANRELLSTLAKIRGTPFLLAAIPLHLLYSLTAIAALVWGTLSYPFTRNARASYRPTQ